MKQRVVVIALAALGFLAGCGSGDDSSKPPAESPTGEPTSQAQVPGVPPKPDAATAAAYVASLEAIDPDVVHGKPDKAVSRGRDQCSSVVEWPEDEARLVGLVQRRFISPDHPEGFGPEKSARILAVVRQYLCPSS